MRGRIANFDSSVCCIYHKPKAVGESSDESSSDSDSSSELESENGAKRKAMDADRARDSMRGRKKGGRHDHKEKRRPSPNAYEKVPKVNGKGKGKAEVGDGGAKAA